MSIKSTLLFVLLVIGNLANGQQKKNIKYVSVNFTNVKFDEALTLITTTYNIPIAYNSAETQKYFVSAHYEQMPIDKVLRRLAKSVNMDVAKINDVYIIKPSKKEHSTVNIAVRLEDITS
ncbi:MAG: hypothetical protein L3J06_02540, partial [Cyclobacteriaceae bacterium]|nr:hypothetical protein [Cyclobacteriaceae bacterium]